MNAPLRYDEFLDSKAQREADAGFEPIWMPDFLFDFQQSLATWAIQKGRAAIFADCGMGKTPIQLVWAENVARHTNGRILILAPLAVSAQTVREGEKFGVEVRVSRDGKPRGNITITNYEQLHRFQVSDYVGVVCDESSILKNCDGKTRNLVTEFLRTIPYRLLCTATAAPNDYIELGTSAEALGHMGFHDMLTKWFKQETTRDHLGWGRTKYRMRAHGEKDFWRWVCSWARACRKPSDLGFDDSRFKLPALKLNELVIESREKRPDLLFDMPAMTLQEQREERRRTITERCETIASLVAHDRPAFVWCHLNDEGTLLTKMIPGAIEISGKDSDEVKEERLLAFISGQVRVIVSKPTICGFGLNLQHCAHTTFFPSHSFEQWYQSIRRFWRFGQTEDVRVDLVTTEGERGVLANLNRKAEQADAMFTHLVELMNNQLLIRRSNPWTSTATLPPWLRTG